MLDAVAEMRDVRYITYNTACTLQYFTGNSGPAGEEVLIQLSGRVGPIC